MDEMNKIWYGCFDFFIIFLHYSKKCCNFAVESPTLGLEGGKCPLSESQNYHQISVIDLTKDPSRGFQDIVKRRLFALCSDVLKLRNFQ